MSGATRGVGLKVALALATVYLVWGSTYLAIRVAVETLPPFGMAGVRFLLSGVILYGWARWSGFPRPTFAQWRAALLTGGLLLLGGNGGVVWAEQYIASGLAALLVATLPVWMALLEWLQQGRRPAVRVLIGLVLGLAGVAGLVRPGADGGTTELWAGLVLVGASISWALGFVYWQKAGAAVPPILGTGMQMLTGGALLFLTGVAAGEPARFDPHAVTWQSLAALGYLFTIGSLLGFTAYVWLLKHARPTLISTYAFVNPVVAVALGCLLLGEPLTWPMVTAGLVVLTSVVLIISAPKASRPRPKAQAPISLPLRAAPAEVSS